MGKSKNNKPAFSFAKLANTDNYKKWAQKIQYSLESVRFWDYIFLNKKNSQLVTIIFKYKDLKDNAKLKYQKKHADKITT